LIAIALGAPMGFIALEAGWVVTEVGRQPWIIQGLVRTSEALTPVPGLIVPFVLFTVLYFGLGVATAFLLYRQIIRTGPQGEFYGTREFQSLRARAALAPDAK
jgi:cytochrome d ubiquinol oxidase subunit I